MNGAITEALGFTWDPRAVRYIQAYTPERALWRFRQVIPGYVYDAGYLEGNPFTYPEVQTLLEGVTVGGRKLTDERQILDLAEAAHELADMVESGRFALGKPVSDRLQYLIARDEALESGMFRGEGRVITNTSVYLGEGGSYHPPVTERGGGNLIRIYEDGLDAILTLDGPFEQAAAYFLFGALQQLYYDGNKRTSRYMMNGHLMAHGIDAISIPAARRLEFNTAMARFYPSRDGSEMFQFLASCWEDMQ